MRSETGIALIVIALACAAFVAAGGGDGDDSAQGADLAQSSLSWRPCGAGGQCATLTVPLDYANPGAGTVDVALFRLRANDPRRRIGALLVNPGGPGESGVGFMRAEGRAITDRLRDRFDLVGFDPRGTGRTDPVQCGRAFSRLLELNLVPETRAERRVAGGGYARFAAACRRRLGPSLGYLATADTARDMDAIRAALGDPGLTYIGYSYGTYLGQVYASMFPSRVRALVLDGVVNAELPPVESTLAQARSVERALRRFLRRCSADAACAFNNGGRSAGAFDALARRVQRRPIRVDGRRLGPTQFWYGVVDPLYSDDQTGLARALARAARGDGGALLKLADEVTGRRRDGTYDVLQQAETAIDCLDGQSLGTQAFPRLETRFRRAAPRAGRFILYSSLGCSYWPEAPRPPQQPVRAEGAPPILVVGATRDPVTPYENAVAVARQLASGVLLTSRGAAHTSFAGLGGPCDAAVIPYLVNGRVPESGTRCTGTSPG